MTQKVIQSKSRQSGIALVIVLWMLSLLIILATGYSRMVRIETGLTANLVHSNQAKAIAEAGVWQAVSELLKPRVEQIWKTDGTNYSHEFKQGNINLKIIDESGKIDLNTARSDLLYGLIQSSDASESTEEDHLQLLQAILDWRDKDNLVRTNGAEDDDYQRLDYEYGAKDGSFNSLDELQLVLGMTTTIYNRLKPALTIHSHQAGINPNSAPREALLAIPGISVEQVDDFIESRLNITDTQTPPPLIGIDSKHLSKSIGQIFSISSEGIIHDTHAKLEVIVLMKQYINRPYSILSWQESSESSKKESESEFEETES